MGRLHSDEPGHLRDRPGRDQIAKTPVETEEDAAGSYRAKDCVGG